MRDCHAYTLENWPRRKQGDLIFQSTNEAIYYANICDDRLATSKLLLKWMSKTYQEVAAAKGKKLRNYNRLLDLVCRAQFFRECYEEIQRLNKEDL